MNKKDGTTCTAKMPASPIDPLEADTPEPGDVTKTKGRSHSIKSAKLGTSDVGDQQEEKTQEEQEPTHWIEIHLKDPDGKPIPDEEYRVKLPDETIQSGRLDDEGKARIEGIPPGQCEVNFPQIHGDEWEPA